MRVLELFSGLGGWRCALGDRGGVVAAYDVSEAANATYALNHGEVPEARELATVPLAELAATGADTWLMSPPCQPFCRMGNHQGLEDRRSLAFLHLMEVFRQAAPDRLVLENVVGFLGSDAHALLSERVRTHGMHQLDLQACPSRFGWPNQRPRVFLVASRKPLKALPQPRLPPRPIAEFLDDLEDETLYLRASKDARHHQGLDLVEAGDCRSACFIGGYGRRFVGSGSFLKTERGVRRFSPSEVARLLGLPEAFRFPEALSLEARYRLLGNSLSIPVAAWALDHL
ncbi:MAG: DNA cytosine methyltransferase [Geothrix sp.]|jgi:DNA (cytosine-5)-methyltransferase 1/tRNA (cytosine38-C5)-methyltransferase|uniref:DNA (cytosine-5-)-methyltransferase n=1 Tax=Candidatus Geothrix odensensis TaxID=2954440 RepID=A0A936K6X0_9BACT|nr:DNA cytosine methyltransferase [Holophagaceae bacterium]MBK8573546.1 DNA cytosine methyltransferase [Candidatus Geothrix odensensis]MBK8790315.1 DNA cytosine methyltransferase [Holophagaceae bacterium]MBP7619296.1 DNA cytosine methyltransferase [Geothrix sp.]MCC6512404.1 DNA cytosine methyltransferase [Geothrix sp.]